jgi:hypothetical protein
MSAPVPAPDGSATIRRQFARLSHTG